MDNKSPEGETPSTAGEAAAAGGQPKVEKRVVVVRGTDQSASSEPAPAAQSAVEENSSDDDDDDNEGAAGGGERQSSSAVLPPFATAPKDDGELAEVKQIDDTILIDPECEELDLNHNRIGRIENLEPLVNIQR